MKYEAGRGFLLLSSLKKHRSPEKPYYREKRIFYYPSSSHICIIDNSGDQKRDGFSHMALERYHVCHDKNETVSYFSDDAKILWKWDSSTKEGLQRVTSCPCSNKRNPLIKKLIESIYRRIYKDIKRVLHYRRLMLSYSGNEPTVKRKYLQQKKER